MIGCCERGAKVKQHFCRDTFVAPHQFALSKYFFISDWSGISRLLAINRSLLSINSVKRRDIVLVEGFSLEKMAHLLRPNLYIQSSIKKLFVILPAFLKLSIIVSVAYLV